MTYVQCKLIKTCNNTDSYTTTFLPAKYAKLDKRLILAGESGWKVIAVYKSTETDKLPYSRGTIRNHRKRTGDSLPK